ncbi:MAG: class II aldolase/adducin family protein [Gemmatimonadetes bacterium]|nr:class II aldolase/adducin family protein [Gemmatimonadota bacterium]
MIRVCRRLWEARLIAGADGNVSVRVGPDALLVTPRGLLKGELTAQDLVRVSLAGAPLGGFRKATSELDLHLRIYQARPDVGAVVHAHPPTATGFAVAGEGLPATVLPELTVLFGEVPLVPYALPGTPAVGAAMAPFLARNEGVLLANHGAVTWGADLMSAQIRMESLEHAARIILAARTIGRVVHLTPEQVHELARPRGMSGHDQAEP